MPQKHHLGLGLLFGIGAGALWGTVFVAPHLASDFGPLGLTIGRYLAYGLIASILLTGRWKSTLAKLGKAEWIGLMWLALCGNTLYYIFVIQAVQLGGIAMASLIMGLVPVAVTIIGSRQQDAVPLRRLLPSILLCLASALAVGWDAIGHLRESQSIAPLIGLAFAFAGLISWTLFVLINSKWLARLRHIGAQDWSLLIGIASGAQSLLLLPIALYFFPFGDHSSEAWLHFAALCLGIALLASVGGNALWNQANRLMPLTLVGQMVLFETLFALLYAFAWEGRGPTLLENFAFACVVASVLSCMAAHRKPSGRHKNDVSRDAA